MKTITFDPVLALFNLGGTEILLLLIVLLILPAMALGGFVLWLTMRRKENSSHIAPVTKRVCPQCSQELSPGSPQGLCPSCLMKVGLGSQFGDANQPSAPTPAMSTDEIGKFFPQLEIVELLGQGGMGMVYKARQPALDRFVALKILSPELSKDPAFAERFSREAKALAKLNHPNIVGVYDFGKAGDFYFFIMEYVDGMNLWQLEQTKKKLSPEEALAIVPKICDALQYAHDEGIVHRDIKPGNILIDKKGRVKIADFGLAKLLSKAPETMPITQSRVTMGTPHYMAPEQIEKPLDVDHRADIYSLGVVFYEMLTGELPIGRFAPPSKKVQVDVRLDEVVLRALEKEPELRFQQASQVKTAVEDVAGIVANLPPHLRPMFATYEYRSKKMLWGLPLLHISFGQIDPATGKPRVAKGIIALGNRAKGVVAIGGIATGGFAFGGFAIGLLAFGGGALGLAAVGGAALALLFAFGGAAVAPIAVGGGACGYFALGGGAAGVHVLASNAQSPLARQFFSAWAGNWLNWLMIIPLSLTSIVPLAMACFMSSKKVADSVGVPDNALRRMRARLLFAGIFSTLCWFPLVPMMLKNNAWSRVLLSSSRPTTNLSAEAQSRDPGKSVSQLAQEGWEFYSTGKMAEALKRFEQLVKLTPEDANAWNGLGWANYYSNKKAAVEAFQKCLSLNPKAPGALNGLGQIYLSEGKLDEAETWLLKAARSHPQASAAWFGLARIYLLEGKFDQATEWAQNAVDAGEGGEVAKRMLQAAKEKHLSDALRAVISPDDKINAQANPPSASAETWSPDLGPNEKPDMSKILDDARKLRELRKYEEALQRHIWYHNHALEYDQGQTGVRLSFALSDWIELGRLYPKARQALVEIRDDDVRKFSEGKGHFKLFMDVHSINEYLQENESTYALFQALENRHPKLARECFNVIENLLVEKGEYEKCFGYIGDPQANFNRIRESRDRMKKWEDDQKLRREEQTKRFQEMAKTNSLYANLPTPSMPAPPEYANPHFVGETRQLIEILVGAGHKPEAENIQEQAAAVLDNPQLKSAVADAEAKVTKRKTSTATKTQTAEPDFRSLLNENQRLVFDWTDRQFRGSFDERNFDGWSENEKTSLETRLIDQLRGPHTQDYYLAINSLAALRSQKALESLRAIAFDRNEKDNRDRWMSVRALGILGDRASVPELIHLIYHGNTNTRWWAQISLVRLTGKNFGNDWQAWGNWWSETGGQPPFQSEMIQWSKNPEWSEPEKLKKNIEKYDKEFFDKLRASEGKK